MRLGIEGKTEALFDGLGNAKSLAHYIGTSTYFHAPRAVVSLVHVHPPSVRLDGGPRVLQLHVLVAHQGPGRQKPAVELEGALKVQHCFFMVGLQWICKKINRREEERQSEIKKEQHTGLIFFF